MPVLQTGSTPRGAGQMANPRGIEPRSARLNRAAHSPEMLGVRSRASVFKVLRGPRAPRCGRTGAAGASARSRTRPLAIRARRSTVERRPTLNRTGCTEGRIPPRNPALDRARRRVSSVRPTSGTGLLGIESIGIRAGRRPAFAEGANARRTECAEGIRIPRVPDHGKTRRRSSSRDDSRRRIRFDSSGRTGIRIFRKRARPEIASRATRLQNDRCAVACTPWSVCVSRASRMAGSSGAAASPENVAFRISPA